MENLEFKSYLVISGSDPLTNQLTEIKVDSVNWRTYLTDGTNNYIKFFPFSEYHGGGGSYFINIGITEFGDWIAEHQEFEQEIRKMLER